MLIDGLFLGIVAVMALLALGNWRTALIAALVLDVARDPVRKLSESQSSLTTIIVGGVWLAALLGAANNEPRELRLMMRRYPQLKSSLTLLVLALTPGLLVSLVNYNHGWILAAIGAASYAGPFVGVVLGYLWPRRVGDVYYWMKVYVLVNSVFLIGSVLEAAELNFPGLGGLKMKWIRNYGTDLITLICGFYRSPDVMGLHAAHVIIFAVLLAFRPRQKFAWSWYAIASWASISLILCGRRKMIVIPLIFLFTYVALLTVVTGRRKLALTLSLLAIGSVAAVQLIPDGIIVENEYARFASSIASEGVERASRSFTDIIVTTVRQSGWMGDGLGTVTQGRQYMGVVTQGKDWQEDGVGRLFKELGIPGVACMLLSGAMLLAALRSGFQAIPYGHPVGRLQIGFCGVVAANLASFAVSHQAYSGDPSTVLFVGFCVGLILGLPRPVWSEAPATPDPAQSDDRRIVPRGHRSIPVESPYVTSVE
jgi:hypothetical protein